LLVDLFEDFFVSLGHQGNPRHGRIFGLSHTQTLDIKPTCTKQPSDAPKDSEFVLDENRERVPAHGVIVGRHIRITYEIKLYRQNEASHMSFIDPLDKMMGKNVFRLFDRDTPSAPTSCRPVQDSQTKVSASTGLEPLSS
jgi:hypothetical protein